MRELMAILFINKERARRRRYFSEVKWKMRKRQVHQRITTPTLTRCPINQFTMLFHVSAFLLMQQKFGQQINVSDDKISFLFPSVFFDKSQSLKSLFFGLNKYWKKNIFSFLFGSPQKLGIGNTQYFINCKNRYHVPSTSHKASQLKYNFISNLNNGHIWTSC